MGRKVALCGMLVALAFVLSYVEFLIPINIGIPGIKLGLANIVVLIAIYTLPLSYAGIIASARIILSGITFGSPASMIYSLCGGIVSFTVMYLLYKKSPLSIYGVSAVGGICHNLGQTLAAMLMLQSIQLFYYFPVLLLSGTAAGTVIGIVAARILKGYGKAYGFHK